MHVRMTVNWIVHTSLLPISFANVTIRKLGVNEGRDNRATRCLRCVYFLEAAPRNGLFGLSGRAYQGVTIDIYFIHQNMPAQFRFLAPALAAGGEELGNVAYAPGRCRSARGAAGDRCRAQAGGGGVLSVVYEPVSRRCRSGAGAFAQPPWRQSAKTASRMAKYILGTDDIGFQVEDMSGSCTVVCAFDFLKHIGFFLPLVGITTVEMIRQIAFDHQPFFR